MAINNKGFNISVSHKSRISLFVIAIPAVKITTANPPNGNILNVIPYIPITLPRSISGTLLCNRVIAVIIYNELVIPIKYNKIKANHMEPTIELVTAKTIKHKPKRTPPSKSKTPDDFFPDKIACHKCACQCTNS